MVYFNETTQKVEVLKNKTYDFDQIAIYPCLTLEIAKTILYTHTRPSPVDQIQRVGKGLIEPWVSGVSGIGDGRKRGRKANTATFVDSPRCVTLGKALTRIRDERLRELYLDSEGGSLLKNDNTNQTQYTHDQE
tara:strand:- start:85 stop:486 length:402 start_codon:yes stop_codon:yes gene_type:complete